MSIPTVRRAFGSIAKQRTLQSVRGLLQIQTLGLLLRIAISFILLPLDNAILFATCLVGHFSVFLSHSNPVHRRQAARRDVHFYPKTIFITGIDTPYGLALARCLYYHGHRVVGADITDLPFASGEGMSKTLAAYYRIPRSHYVSRLLDIIQREKADIWIPCSSRASVLEDAMAKQAIESRTACKCIHLDTELVNQFSDTESFTQYLVEKKLPVVENYQVQSRDSIHKILHRSPSKVYHMRRPDLAVSDNKVVTLPKRTLSMTYTEVSEIQISKDRPWVLQQQARLGEFFAELLLVSGQVKAIKIRPADNQPWGHSRLDEGLALAIHRLMDRFAFKGGHRMTGHLCLRLMVDEEFDANNVRYVTHIAGCTQGTTAVRHLLEEPSPSLIDGYLAVLSSQPDDTSADLDRKRMQARASISAVSRSKFTFYKTLKQCDVRRVLPSLYPVAQQLDHLVSQGSDLLLFWKDPRFSVLDPLPWWWNAHIYQPLKGLEVTTEIGAQATATSTWTTGGSSATSAISGAANAPVNGNIYLHRISDPRMTPAAIANLCIFWSFFGESNLPAVALASTLWDYGNLSQSRSTYEVLKFTYWKGLLDKGSRTFPCDDGPTTGKLVIKYLCDRKQPVVFDIQKEAVDQGLRVEQTNTGTELRRPLGRFNGFNRWRLMLLSAGGIRTDVDIENVVILGI
ncbi:hypothetical protein G4B84_007981 [Aspergillus flavus NRRL3357]|nr:uncharacterized protein G4B84_007981 [Aspergillus flavus NRRL3357]QMW32550.1 hypothetical protein G4B84_007981 [Aspergillus flavus NRRL3357]